MPATATEPFHHEALLYEGHDAFVDVALPFVLDGLDEGEPVMVAVTPAPAERLRDALGSRAGEVRFAEMVTLGRNPARIIPVWRDFLDEADGPARGIGEPVWHGRREAELVECRLHEAMINLAFARDAGFRLLCPYDAGRLDEAVIHGARCTHPFVNRESSTHYREPRAPLSPDETPLASAPPDAAVLGFDRSALRQVRAFVREHAEAAGLERTRAEDLVLAVNEVATNSATHGGGNGVLRMWPEDGGLVCEVRDQGVIDDLLVGRRPPLTDQLGGWGVWIANQVCDLVQVRTGPGGSTIRLFVG
jgi:anti-sigma regulatory factor (Ser/Thr protein kinase)